MSQVTEKRRQAHGQRRAAHAIAASVLALMREHHRPLAAYELVKLLAKDSERVAPQQVYRALSHLQERRLVRRIESLNSFCLGEEGGDAIVYCSSCGEYRTVQVGDYIDRFVELIEETGFDLRRTIVELRGKCGDCTEAAVLESSS